MTNEPAMDEPNLHIVLVPLMAQGHMIPMMDIARLLAERGVLVTVITTPYNASRFKPTIDRAHESGLPIRFVPLRFPCAETGLPDGCENLDVVPKMELFKNFFEATRLLRQPVEQYLREHQPKPDGMISDMCHPWTMDVARALRIPRLVFHGFSCFALLCIRNIAEHNLYDQTVTDENEPFLVPDLAQRIEVTRATAPRLFNVPGWEKLRDATREAESSADGVVINTFNELETLFVESYQKAMGKKVWAIGPLSLYNKDVASKAARGKKASVDEHRCLMWLDSMEPRSVVYVSFGSVTHTKTQQLIEIGLGLEASNSPFIWVIKETEKSPEVEEWLAEGFEERTCERSLIIKGWAPQVMIFSHPAIGRFITHCGWNSSLEAVSAGLPMLTWPHFADQFLNEKLIVEVLRIGVSVGVKKPITYADENNFVLIKRDEVEKAVRSLMDEGEEGEERRERARKFGEKARKAMEEGGSSHENLTDLIQFISNHPNMDMEGKDV